MSNQYPVAAARQQLPYPPELADRKGFETWLMEMRTKLATDGLAIGNAKARFFYVYSRFGAFKTQYLDYVAAGVTDADVFFCQSRNGPKGPEKKQANSV